MTSKVKLTFISNKISVSFATIFFFGRKKKESQNKMSTKKPNSTGLILHQQAAESVHDLKKVLDALATAVPAAVPPKPAPNNTDGAEPSTSSTTVTKPSDFYTNNNINNASLSVTEQILKYESNRSDVLRLRKKLLIEFRQKLIQPLALASTTTHDHAINAYERVIANPKCEEFRTTPLLQVHSLTLELLSIDQDMKDELNSDSPMTMNDLANSAANSRGKSDLASLIPVAWCIRVSYVEAVKFEMYLSSSSSAVSVDEGSSRSLTVSERLKKLECWKSVSELGAFPRNVMEYIVEQLQ